jgi:hypothetical protein
VRRHLTAEDEAEITAMHDCEPGPRCILCGGVVCLVADCDCGNTGGEVADHFDGAAGFGLGKPTHSGVEHHDCAVHRSADWWRR